MHKIYLLLRNNKQSGPHTLEELIKLQLKPLDLVWVEGKSSAWCYPSEIDTLKAYLGQNEQKDKDSVYPKSDKSLVLPRTQKPNAKNKVASVTPAKVYVKLPDLNNFPAADEKPTTFPDAPAELPGEHVEEKAQDQQGLNVKYTRTLDDIKEQYSEWIYNQNARKKPLVSAKYLWVAVIAIGIIATGFVVQKLVSGMKETKEQQASAQLVKNAGSGKSSKNASNRKGSSLNKKGKKNKKANQAPAKIETANQAKNLPDGRKVDSVAEHTSTGKENEADNIQLFSKVHISFVYDSANLVGIRGLRFILHNQSEVTLNTVGVNVFYQVNGENQPQKKTIYFNNILPHGSMDASAPDHDKAASVSFRLGFISTQDHIYYGKD